MPRKEVGRDYLERHGYKRKRIDGEYVWKGRHDIRHPQASFVIRTERTYKWDRSDRVYRLKGTKRLDTQD